MRVIRIEGENRDWLGVTLVGAVGLGLGVVTGIVVSGLLGSLPDRVGRALRRARGPGTRRADNRDALREAIRGALAEHPATRSLALDVRALGDGIVELTGTVPDTETRDLAGSVARGVAGASIVVNRMLIAEPDRPLRRTPSAAN